MAFTYIQHSYHCHMLYCSNFCEYLIQYSNSQLIFNSGPCVRFDLLYDAQDGWVIVTVFFTLLANYNSIIQTRDRFHVILKDMYLSFGDGPYVVAS